MPPSDSVTVVAVDEKHEPIAFVTAGVYGCVVPAIGARHVPVAAIVAVIEVAGVAPGEHEVVAIGDVQSGEVEVEGAVVCPSVCTSGRNTIVGDRSSSVSASLPSLWMLVCS